MKVKLILLGILVFATQIESFCTISVKKEKHFGKVTSILGNYEGNILIHLQGENEEQIEIELKAVKEKSKGSKYTQTSSIVLNVAAIRSIEIDGKIYVLRNIEFEMNKLYKNCCIQKELEDKEVVLYSWQQNKKTTLHVLQFKGYSSARTLQMASVVNIISAFKSCNTLYEKIRAKQDGYVIDANATEEERYLIWKKWIEESLNCNSN